jgi:cell wall-associated NlpC family hydrolase
MSSAFSKKLLVAALSVACLLVLAPGAWAQSSSNSGGAAFVPPPPPPAKATLVNGRLLAPASAPRRVKQVITAANRIVEKPYVYGGGHTAYRSGSLDRGYDCSGAVSYALHGGRFLRSPLPSGALMSWGRRGPGRWITVYAHGGHA